jgi:hypothetical protein
MGSFFANVQILNKKKISKEEMLSALREGLQQHGFTVLVEGEGDAGMAVLFSPNDKWFSLYVESLEQTTLAEIKEYGQMFSNIFMTDVVISEVFDSDVLLMLLNGSETDLYVSDPTGMYDEEVGLPHDHKGHARKWVHLLDGGHTEKEIKKIWKKEYVFMDEQLSELGSLFGFNEMASHAGYDLLDEMMENEQDAHFDCIKLSLKKASN